jgi:hypothetical protein
MVKIRKVVFVSVIVLILLLFQRGFSLTDTNNTPYYFYSASENPFSADNQIFILVSNKSFAYVKMSLHIKARYPSGIGHIVTVPIPYPLNEIFIINVTLSNKMAKYQVNSNQNETEVEVEVLPSLNEAYLQITYIVNKIYQGDEFKFKFKLSSTATELVLNVLFENKTNWVDRKSFEVIPKASKETCFVVAEEAMPFTFTVVLSNVMPKTITLFLKTQAAPLKIENIPLYGMGFALVPCIFITTSKLIRGLAAKRKIGVTKIAYRNILRQPIRFFLTIIGIVIPSTILTIALTQMEISEQLLSAYNLSGIEWPLLLVLIITIVTGCFQVANTIFSSVLERIKEIGVMKAIGFRNSFITKMIITESVLIGCIAGVIGAILGVSILMISYNPVYGALLSNDVVAYMMSSIFGEVDIMKPWTFIENPWYRNCILAVCVLVIVHFIVYSKVESISSSIVTIIFFTILLRPVDPFFLKLFLQIVPFLVFNIFIAVLFSVSLSAITGFLISKKATEIDTAKVMEYE